MMDFAQFRKPVQTIQRAFNGMQSNVQNIQNLQKIDESKILDFVRFKGPLIPSEINKELNTDVLFASAMLSEMVDKKKIRLTSLKVGSTPVYYMQGQEYKLQNYIKHLNEKDQQTCELLKSKRILKDREQTPLVRASLRLTRDFCVPLEVTVGDKKEMYWKWYLITPSEAEALIKESLGVKEPAKEIEKEKIAPIKKEDTALRPAQKITPQNTLKEQEDEQNKIKKAAETKLKDIKDQRDKIEREKEKAEKLENIKKSAETAEKDEQQKASEFIDRGVSADKFFRKIKAYFDSKEIKIKNFKIIRKESDIEFNIILPSSVGELTYFCRAKDKKKCNDAELSSIYVLGQTKKMPVLFITTGELTKKAADLLNTEFRNITYKKI